MIDLWRFIWDFQTLQDVNYYFGIIFLVNERTFFFNINESNLSGTNENTSVRICNLLGKELSVLIDEMSPGEYEVIWDARKYLSGVYFCRLNSGDLIITRKLILLK